MTLLRAIALAWTILSGANAKNFVFETRLARLVISPDALAVSLTEKPAGKERWGPKGVAFAAVRKSGALFSASLAERHGEILHVTFGTSGISADYRITAFADYLIVELVAIRGDGIEEVRLMQVDVPLKNSGDLLAVRWDDEFTVSLMGLSPRVNSRVTGQLIVASVYPGFATVGERVAIIATPTARFLEVVRRLEHDFGLPSPTIGGTWAKVSEEIRTSYLFTDLTEANASETIRYAKLGGFRYILVYAAVWSTSLGSYPINTRNYPRGEESLKAVIDKCHAAGLKVGMHMLTSFVGKDDPLVRPKPDHRLLKDGQATLSRDLSATATEMIATTEPIGMQVPDAVYGPANDILIDDEIIHYGQIDGAKFIRCVRGFAGTEAAGHKAGAKMHHLAERVGSYLADLRTPLKDLISDRVAGVINRCGFDMIYFDGGEVNAANGPAWYWLGPQQAQIWEKSKRELLVQGSGMTGWTWHIFARGACDDYSAVAVKQYLDYHKIADTWRAYRNSFVAAELGWWGFLQDSPDHPATIPDEVEYYAVRMLALNTPVSLETNLPALKANGRTEEMLELLRRYEELRLGGTVPKSVRDRLSKGEWHMTKSGEFHAVRYDPQRVAVPGPITFQNEFGEQPLKFRLQVTPRPAPAGDPLSIVLLRAQPAIDVPQPDANATMPGQMAWHLELSKPAPELPSGLLVRPEGAGDKTSSHGINLTKHRALVVGLSVDRPVRDAGETAVLNIQLEAAGKTYRDYYVDLNFSGPKTVSLFEPGTNRTLAEFRPAAANYPFKAAMYGFDYGNIVALNLRWMRYPRGSGVHCRINFVEALWEQSIALTDIGISTSTASLSIPGGMKTGDYAEYWGEGPLRIFDHNGVLLKNAAVSQSPVANAGLNQLALKATGSGQAIFTAISLAR
jgi:hypothetical protein